MLYENKDCTLTKKLQQQRELEMLQEDNRALEIERERGIFSPNICYAQFQIIIERMFSFKERTKDTQVEGEKPTPFSLNVQRASTCPPSCYLQTQKRKKKKNSVAKSLPVNTQ